MKKIALIAHDQKKMDMVFLVKKHKSKLNCHKLITTATTGRIIKEETGLKNITALLSGPLGGDQQIGALIANHQIDLVIFMRDPLAVQAHEADISALLRICDVHNVPVATNIASADLLCATV